MSQRQESIPDAISLYRYKRFVTREVQIGSLWMGGDHPVRIQSMVNTPPEDIDATIAQIKALAEAGCELVRLAVPSMRDAGQLPEIRKRMAEAGVDVPLVADVHFNPAIAEYCAQHVEKVRINPGNYKPPGSKTPAVYDSLAIRHELDETETLLARLAGICRAHGTAIRVGSNHGSLSPRILHQYGDTPEGMVEGAMEFVRILHHHGFHNMVVSMKSSNVRIMIQACRLLVIRMQKEGLNYPLHLGVTEAGLGLDGRIRSAAGIGLLLDDGIGDTIRVSLTEDPVREIPVAKTLTERFPLLRQIPTVGKPPPTVPFNPLMFSRRKTHPIAGIGGENPVVVVAGSSASTRPDWQHHRDAQGEWLQQAAKQAFSMPCLCFDDDQIILPEDAPVALMLPDIPQEHTISRLKHVNNAVLVIPVSLITHPGIPRMWIAKLDEADIRMPVVLRIKHGIESSDEETAIHCAVTASGLFADGLADGLWLDATGVGDPVALALNILQATRARISSTEFISCPSCGRTRFNIEEAVHKIRAKTAHLPGLKIAVMGCVVNGPGEMADADYGYVGAGNGTITLYKGKRVMQRQIPEEHALDALILLIKENGQWKDPE